MLSIFGVTVVVYFTKILSGYRTILYQRVQTLIKEKWQQKFLSSHFKETPKLYNSITEFLYLLYFVTLEILSCPPSWILADMRDTSQVGSRNFIFLRNND